MFILKKTKKQKRYSFDTDSNNPYIDVLIMMYTSKSDVHTIERHIDVSKIPVPDALIEYSDIQPHKLPTHVTRDIHAIITNHIIHAYLSEPKIKYTLDDIKISYEHIYITQKNNQKIVSCDIYIRSK